MATFTGYWNVMSRISLNTHTTSYKRDLTVHFLSSLTQYSKNPQIKNCKRSLLFIIVLIASVAGSSNTASFADQSASVIIYNKALRHMIECLRFSPLAQALTMAESVNWSIFLRLILLPTTINLIRLFISR